ncbi:MAG: hypothetical protein ACRC28_03915 [Clostridium sp.]|uniref:hypothetical protein n=1 Tax=Clostridium sp. TaxID=1506 RepID=UPI003F324FFA
MGEIWKKERKALLKIMLVNFLGVLVLLTFMMESIEIFIKGETVIGVIEGFIREDTGFTNEEGDKVYTEIPIVNISIAGKERRIELENYITGGWALFSRRVEGDNIFSEGERLKLKYLEKKNKAVIKPYFIFRESRKFFNNILGLLLVTVMFHYNNKFKSEVKKLSIKNEALLGIIGNLFQGIILFLIAPMFIKSIVKSPFNFIDYFCVGCFLLPGLKLLRKDFKVFNESKIKEKKILESGII